MMQRIMLKKKIRNSTEKWAKAEKTQKNSNDF